MLIVNWNDGIVGIEEENMIIICQEFLQTHYSNIPVLHYSKCGAKRS